MPRNVAVRDIMTTDLLVLAPGDKVADATRRLVDAGVDAAPVVDGDRVVGMLSTGDLIVSESRLHLPTVVTLLGATLELPSSQKRFDRELEKMLGATVGEVMTSKPVTITADDTVETAATLMHDHKVSRLPVVDGERLVGLVSRGDIIRAIVEAGSAGGE